MTDTTKTRHERALETIGLRISSQGNMAPAAGPGASAATRDSLDRAFRTLKGDRETLLAHWDFSSMTTPDGAAKCECRQPCPVANDVIEHYIGF